MWEILKHVFFSIFQAEGGLLPHKEDERDFSFSWTMGGAGYVPKHKAHEIATLSIKDQSPHYTCVWNSATVQKEVDEGKELSVRYLVADAKKKGLLWSNGIAYLRDAQKLICSSGICEASLCPEVKTLFADYSRADIVSYSRQLNAQTHKSKSYFIVRTKDEWLKALDDGHIIHTGTTWRTSYNMSGGFKAPWVLPIGKGAATIGHAFVCKGYDMGKNLLKFQNSYGIMWGDKGCFYAKIDEWFRTSPVGYVSMDYPVENLVAAYEGKDVKGTGPAIYRIESGQKRVFPNEDVFFKHGGKFGLQKTWVSVADSILKSIPEGQPMS